MSGLVIKSTGSSYVVYFKDGKTLECHVKGNFRIRGIRSTSPVAVGDYVEVNTLPDGTNWITDIAERRNYIIRRSTNLSKESHILAANLDQVLLLVTISHPVTSTTFIDRFLATAEAYRVPTVLLFNKVDLLDEEEQTYLQTLCRIYEAMGYTTVSLSARNLTDTLEQFAALRRLLKGKVTLLSGNSGVGKSTLLNAVFGETLTRTGIISSAHDKGMHTTTFSEMYPLPFDNEDHSGWVIDTPGIKGFGAVAMEKEEVAHYFRDIFRVGRNCKYGNCLHTGEPGCAVYQAVVDGEIATSRYESYLSLLGDCEERKYR
ncbi:MAG: ribosome small subunit-dependent GTPase A [Paludibacteraceae bacterium]|nr:ribosome small subunit-dependent GTPase A [Paludibacteraceae bacterium]